MELYGAVDRRARLRQVPAVALEALKLVWRASRREFIVTLALQALTGVGVAIQLLAIRQVLTGLTGDEWLGFGVCLAAGSLVYVATRGRRARRESFQPRA